MDRSRPARGLTLRLPGDSSRRRGRATYVRAGVVLTLVAVFLLARYSGGSSDNVNYLASRSSDTLSSTRRTSKQALYSAHNCVGQSVNTPSIDSMRCRFKNVCLELLEPLDPYGKHKPTESSVRLSYFRPPAAKSAPLYWYSEFRLELPWVRIDRDSPLIPEIIYESIPQEADWSPAVTTVLTEAFWPENFGHSLGDDYLPPYRLARSFGLWDRKDVSVIFHPGCLSRSDSDRGCAHHARISSLLLDRPVITRNSPLWTSGAPVCFSNLLVGTRELGMGFPSEHMWPGFLNEMKTHLGVSTVYRPKKQKVSVFLKHGRRTITNYDELQAHLAKRFEVEVELVDPSLFDLPQQFRMMQDTTLVISPCGGVSFSAMFLSPGASAIFIDYWNADWNTTAQMERHIYSYQSDVTPFYYPLEYADLSWDTSKVPVDALANRFDLERNYANVTVSLDRMESYVLAGLLQAEVSFGLSRSFKFEALA